MSMDGIAQKNAVLIVTTTKFVTPSLETVANVMMVIKMQNVMKVSFKMCNFMLRDFKKQNYTGSRVNFIRYIYTS